MHPHRHIGLIVTPDPPQPRKPMPPDLTMDEARDWLWKEIFG